jgi:integrase
MPLTDTAIRNAKPKAKPYKLTDEKGLFLLVQPSGGKLWRFKFRVDGRNQAGQPKRVEKKLAFGAYPDISLRDARRLCDEARAHAKLNAANSFEAVAQSYIEKCKREGRAGATTAKQEWLLKLLDRAIGHRPIADIQPFEMLEAVRKYETTGRTEAARRALQFASQVFRFAIANQLAASDPTRDLRGALTSHKSKHHAAILEPKKVGELLRAIDGYDGHPVTRYALQLAALVFVRPGELRHAEWSEIDIEAKVWRIPTAKMKARVEHVVPLSEQTLLLLDKVRELTGDSQYVFPSIRTRFRPMSENTVNAALRRLGYAKDEMTGHGFRAMASTLLNESGKWSPDAIERALAHKDKDAVRAAYHRGAHWQERVEMAQWWADHLDTLRTGATILKLPSRVNIGE